MAHGEGESETSIVKNAGPSSPEADDPNLDLLRSVAVFSVLLGHLTHFLGLDFLGPIDLHLLGELGVLLFFVHTSLVLMFSLERMRAQQQSSLFAPFMLRRVFRIYPLSIFVVTVTLVLRLPLADFRFLQLDRLGVVANVFLFQNLVNRESVVGPLWSLPYEMQMYLFLPALFLLVRRICAVWQLWLLWAATLVLALLGRHYSPIPNSFFFFPCFFPGVMAYYLKRTTRRRLPAALWPLVLVGVVLFHLQSRSLFVWLSIHRLMPWITCLLLGLATPFFARISRPTVVEGGRYVAKYSFGIYLVHTFCIWFAFVRIHSRHWPISAAIFMLLLVGLPVGLYHLIEEPMIRLGKSLARQTGRPREALSATVQRVKNREAAQ